MSARSTLGCLPGSGGARLRSVSPGGRSRQSGYAFLMVMGMILMMAVLSQVLLQNVLTEGRRTREDEMIWRGKQYVRAIRLYFRKTGHYPQTIDDLKTGLPEMHFLRYAAYKDPMAKDKDGAWRFIYINASGQIIGSVRYATLQQMALMDLNGGTIPLNATLGSIGTPVAALAAPGIGANNSSQSGTGPNGTSSTSTGNSPPSSPGTVGSGDNSGPGGTPNPSSSPTTSSASSNASGQPVSPLSLLKPTGPVDGPVLGGLLTGVGGGTDSDAASIKVVSGGKKYKDWEFIWNPLEDQARAMQAGLGGLNQGGVTGAPGPTSNFGNPGSTNPGFGGALVNPTNSQPQQQPPSQPQN
jgi:hypothetical protein